jgi:hypothetical protein
MKRCNHTDWLTLYTQNDETIFLETDRLSQITGNIPNLESQYPTLFTFIGSTEKYLALQELLGLKPKRQSPFRIKHGELHLWLDPSSIFQDRPILFADGDFREKPVYSSNKTGSDPKCHEIRRQRSPTHLSQDEIAESIYSRLLHPFTDVFCLFPADIGGFRSTACRIAKWLEKGQVSSLPKITHPRLVIVTESIEPRVDNEKATREYFLLILSIETTKNLFDLFSGLDVIAIFPQSRMSNQSRHRRLKEHLMNISDQVRRNRANTHTLFSAQHFNAFFKHACQHFYSTLDEPFDFIKAARKFNPVPGDLQKHLSHFLEYIKSPQELVTFAIPIIASSFCLDSYPPEAPSK